MTIMPLLLRCLVCFALGSVPFAIVSLLGTAIDIRKVGSGNPGFNNVLRISKKRAVVALIGDLGKGYLAVWLVYRCFPLSAVPHPLDAIALGWIYGFSAVLGHCFSPFLRFSGGKGIATSGGVMLVLYPLWAIAALLYFTAARITLGRQRTREAGTIASLTTWLLFTILMLAFVGRQHAYYALVMTVFLAGRHTKNLANLLAPAASSEGTDQTDQSLASGTHVKVNPSEGSHFGDESHTDHAERRVNERFEQGNL